MASAFDLIAGTYVTIYNRAADPQGAVFWANNLGFPSLAAASAPGSANLDLADQLGRNFYAASTAAFNALYPQSMLDSQFINNVYVNLGGLGPDGAGATFWQNRLTSLEGANSQQVARAIVAAEIAFVLQTFDPNATGDAKVRSDTYKNKITVSEATATTGNASFNPTSQSTSDPAYAGLTNVLIGVNNTSASVNGALAQVQAANAASNPALMTGQFQTSFSLTPQIDTFTAVADNTVFNALPQVQSSGLENNTLNTGDSLTNTFKNATLNFTAGVNGVAANPPFATGVTISGVQNANITNQSAAIAGFQGNVTGLLVENNVNSVAGVQLGGQNQGLNTLLTNINISGYGGPNGSVMNSAIFAASKGSAAATIAIDIKGTVGSTNADLGGANILRISNDTGTGTKANPNLTYGTWAITSANTANLQLEQDFQNLAGSGVGGAQNLVLAGAGDIAVGQNGGTDAGHWQLLQTIDLSKSTGRIAITGATSGTATQAFATEANDGWLFGSAVGLLDNTGTGGEFNLTKVTLGSGQTFLDVSSASAAQVGKLTTAVGTGVAANLTNEIIVKNAVATTLSTDTFKNISGFNVLGIGGATAADGAGGIINMANLPATIGTIIYQTKASADVFINNQVAALTVNTEDNGNNENLTVGKVGPAAGLSDEFHLISGNSIQNTVGNVGNVRLFGDEKVTITSAGTGVGANDVDQVLITSTSNIPIVVTIDGTRDIDIGNSGGKNGGAIAHVNDAADGLILNSMQLFITNTGVTTLHGSANAGSVLDFPIAGNTLDGSKGNPLSSSTNAVLIDASKSGGLIMEAGDSNFVVSPTVAGSTGATIIGSETAGNVLMGSIGNDKFVSSKSIGTNDTIATGGGADIVTLTPGNGSDHVDLFSAFDTKTVAPGSAAIPRFHSITDSNDVPQLGWWGQATGATATGYQAGGFLYAGIATGKGTNLDEVKVSGFESGTDVIDIGANSGFNHGSIWGSGGNNGLIGGGVEGLVQGNVGSINVPGGPGSFLDANFQNVNSGDNIGATTRVVALTGQTFFDATAVSAALENNTYNINLAAPLNNNNSMHIIIAYQDFSGNAHIADLALIANTGTTANIDVMDVHVADMVQLTGVSLAQLVSNENNIHFV
jgi:hypothetical protein